MLKDCIISLLYINRFYKTSIVINKQLLTNKIFKTRTFDNSRYFIKTEAKSNLPDSESNVSECKTSSEKLLLPENEEKKLKVLKLEYDVFYSSGVRVPLNVTDEQWMKLLKYNSISARKRYYSYLFKNEKYRMNKEEKVKNNLAIQNERRLAILKKQEEGLEESFKNTFLLFIRESSMNMFYYNNIYRSMINGPHLVFDFAFEKNLTEREMKDLIKQIFQSHGLNKTAKEPFHFHFCNLDPSSLTYQKLNSALPDINEVPITITKDSYLQLYPKDKLVYLSPNASEVMTQYDPDLTYIVGSIVDKAVEVPLTMAKAKKENIRMMKFPLDRYVKWVQGTKALSLNHVVDILIRLKDTQDWMESLMQSLPKRKFIPVTEEEKRLNENKKNKKYGVKYFSNKNNISIAKQMNIKFKVNES